LLAFIASYTVRAALNTRWGSAPQKDHMKIQTRDLGLLAVGFVLGAIITVWLTSTPSRPATISASRVVATGPVLPAFSLPPRLTTTNIQWGAPPIHIVLPPRFIDSFDSQSPLYPPMRQPVDLIDTRFQSDIKLDDLK
jgi:hypothetical protein